MSRKEDQMPVDLKESPLGRKIKEALEAIREDRFP
jgi:hypothetical protein